MSIELTLTIRPVAPVPGAVLHVYIEDTTYMDTPARVLWHGAYPAAPAADGTQVVELIPPALPGNTRCTVRAHLSFNHHETITPGDYITTESYSFPPTGTLRLHRVP